LRNGVAQDRVQTDDARRILAPASFREATALLDYVGRVASRISHSARLHGKYFLSSLHKYFLWCPHVKVADFWNLSPLRLNSKSATEIHIWASPCCSV